MTEDREAVHDNEAYDLSSSDGEVLNDYSGCMRRWTYQYYSSLIDKFSIFYMRRNTAD